MLVVATQNFRTVDIVLLSESTNATFSSQVKTIGQPAARELLKYLSSELNRLYFQLWNVLQVVLGLLAVWLLWVPGPAARARCPFVVECWAGGRAVMTLWLQPEITVGRTQPRFRAPRPPPPALGRFWVLHGEGTLRSSSASFLGVPS